MKMGLRKPSIKKSISARTTGKLKRQFKKSVNPLYGKSGMGIINDPKKAIYNKVYNKTTVGLSDVVSTGNTKSNHKMDMEDYLFRLGEMSPDDFTEEELDAMSVEELAAIQSGVQYRKESKFASIAFKVIAVIVAVIFGLPGLFGGIFPLFVIAIIIAFLLWKFGNALGKEAKNKK